MFIEDVEVEIEEMSEIDKSKSLRPLNVSFSLLNTIVIVFRIVWNNESCGGGVFACIYTNRENTTRYRIRKYKSIRNL